MKLTLEVIGSISKDAEIRENSKGKKYVSFSVPYEKYDSKTKQSVTYWVNVMWFLEPAPGIMKHLKKGIQVFVRGQFEVKTSNDPKSPACSFFLYPYEVSLLSFVKEGPAEGE